MVNFSNSEVFVWQIHQKFNVIFSSGSISRNSIWFFSEKINICSQKLFFNSCWYLRLPLWWFRSFCAHASPMSRLFRFGMHKNVLWAIWIKNFRISFKWVHKPLRYWPPTVRFDVFNSCILTVMFLTCDHDISPRHICLALRDWCLTWVEFSTICYSLSRVALLWAYIWLLSV